MFFLQFISKLIKVLRSGESPGLIAGGFAMGFVIRNRLIAEKGNTMVLRKGLDSLKSLALQPEAQRKLQALKNRWDFENSLAKEKRKVIL